MGVCVSSDKTASVSETRSIGGAVTALEKGLVYRVKLIGALNLRANPKRKSADSEAVYFESRDPYVILSSTGTPQRYLSTVVVHNRDCPSWNEEFFFTVNTAEPTLKLEVWDKNGVSGDEIVGVAKVSLRGLLARRGDRECWVPLIDPASEEKPAPDVCGEIGFAVVECYRLEVRIERAVGIKPLNPYVLKGMYAMARVGSFQAPLKTDAVGTDDPVWWSAETPADGSPASSAPPPPRVFFVPYGQPSQLELQVWTQLPVGDDVCRAFFTLPLRGVPAPAEVATRVELGTVWATRHEAAKGLPPPTLAVHLRDDVAVDASVTKPAPLTTAERALLPPDRPMTRRFACKVFDVSGLNYVRSERVAGDGEEEGGQQAQPGALASAASKAAVKIRAAAGSLGLFLVARYADQGYESKRVHQHPAPATLAVNETFVFTMPPRLLQSQLSEKSAIKTPPAVPTNLEFEVRDHLMSGWCPASQVLSARAVVEALRPGAPMPGSATSGGETVALELQQFHSCVVRVVSCRVFND